MRNGRKIRPSALGVTTSLGNEMRITKRSILRELELLDWSGHVELPYNDMAWLASMLYVKLTSTAAEVCEACGKATPVVATTPLGPICAECVRDWEENIDQIEDVLGE